MASILELPKVVLTDVDGVLTDGSLYFSSAGDFVKSFNSKDGVAVRLLHFFGIKVGVLSGRSSASLDARLSELAIDSAVTGCSDKVAGLEKIVSDLDVLEHQVVYVGDDVLDLPLRGRVGYFYAPSDAHVLVRESADWVTKATGGSGVLREVAESVLMRGGLDLKQIYSSFLGVAEPGGWTSD